MTPKQILSLNVTPVEVSKKQKEVIAKMRNDGNIVNGCNLSGFSFANGTPLAPSEQNALSELQDTELVEGWNPIRLTDLGKSIQL